jgi:hypothetical protein
MRKKQWLLIFGWLIISLQVFSQVEEQVSPTVKDQKEKSSFGQRLVFGGDIGLSFGSITYIKLAPVIGYRLTPRLTTGVGPIYIYENYKDYRLESSTYGGKAILSFALVRSSENGGLLSFGNILLHAENEVISVEPVYMYFNGPYPVYFLGNRLWIDNLLVGGGLSQPIGGRFSASVFILWDITQNKYSPYTNPIFKFGFDF